MAARHHRPHLIRACVAVLACALIAPSSAVASPVSNARIEAAREEAAAANAKLDDLAAELEERSETYLE
ncbi:MAG: hypothetical protein FDZ75_03925, partial [Actinobacteria bacterium]